MEKLLTRLARQLDSLDEASLMALWSKYAVLTSRFEPTARWEEACLIFSLIQAKHWKNQLFNYCWLQQRKPPIKQAGASEGPDFEFGLEEILPEDETPEVPCRVLQFRLPVDKDQNEEQDT